MIDVAKRLLCGSLALLGYDGRDSEYKHLKSALDSLKDINGSYYVKSAALSQCLLPGSEFLEDKSPSQKASHIVMETEKNRNRFVGMGDMLQNVRSTYYLRASVGPVLAVVIGRKGLAPGRWDVSAEDTLDKKAAAIKRAEMLCKNAVATVLAAKAQ